MKIREKPLKSLIQWDYNACGAPNNRSGDELNMILWVLRSPLSCENIRN